MNNLYYFHFQSHMVHSEHDVNFYALLKQVKVYLSLYPFFASLRWQGVQQMFNQKTETVLFEPLNSISPVYLCNILVKCEEVFKSRSLLQLTEEAAKLDWTKSRGHTLSGHNLQHYEDDEDNDNLIGLSHKLGGQTSVFNARASSVVAAYSRLAHASSNPSEAIEMHQASNAGDSLQSNHLDALVEKQLDDVKVVSVDVPSDDQRKSEPDPDDCGTGSPMKHEPHIELNSDDHKMRSLPPPLEAKLSEEPDPDDCSAEKLNTGTPSSLEPDPDEHTMGIEKKVTAGQNCHASLGHHVNEEERGSLTHTNQDDFPLGIKLVEPCTNNKDIIPDGVSSTVIDEPDPDDQELQRIQDPVAIICSRLQKAIGVLRSQANPLEASRVVQTILKIIRYVELESAI